MPAEKYTRVGDFTDDESANKAGRVDQDSAQLDAEYDALLTAVNAHADDIDVLLRDDNKMKDDILQGHEFAAACITYLKAAVGNQNAALNWRGDWVTATSYSVGDLILDNGGSDNIYICLVAHTSGVFATDLAAGKWQLFLPTGSVSFPGGASTDDVLYYNGSTQAWGKVTAARTDGTFAPKTSPALTGTATAVNLTVSGTTTLNGRLVSDVHDYGSVSANLAIDLSESFLQMVTLTGAAGITLTTSNRVQGAVIELYITASTSDRALTVTEGWNWYGYKPDNIRANKNMLLQLRCVTGTAVTDVYASIAEVL